MDDVVLGLALDGIGWARPLAAELLAADPAAADVLFDAGRYVRLADDARRAGFTFVSLDDSLGSQTGGRLEAWAHPDAVLVMARIAPVVADIGLVATVTATHTEPFHVSKALATLDHVSGGRAGWQVSISTTAAEAGHVGRRPAVAPELGWQQAGEVADVVGRLWDSWEDGAVIRDVASGRFIDADRLHHVHFVGTQFSLVGPSTAPRPPQGQLPVVVAVDQAGALVFASAAADVVVLRGGDLGDGSARRTAVLAAVAAAGRDPGAVRVLAEVAVALDGVPAQAPAPRIDVAAAAFSDRMRELAAGTGLDGFVVRLGSLDEGVRLLATASERSDAALASPPSRGGTLRDRLGLMQPANRYARPIGAGSSVVRAQGGLR